MSRTGNPYYTFDLGDGKALIRVFLFGQASCRKKASGMVEGRFEKVRRVGCYTFHNEVTATKVTCS